MYKNSSIGVIPEDDLKGKINLKNFKKFSFRAGSSAYLQPGDVIYLIVLLTLENQA